MTFKEKYINKQRESSNICDTPPFPKILKIDTCNICNYSCVFCPQSKQSGKCGSIDYELCKKIIQDGFYAGARELCLSMTGEPLLNKHLEEYVMLAKRIGYEYVFINTNGYFCDEERGLKLLESGIDSIKFSINASSEMYELIHGVDAYSRVTKNLKNLFDNRNRIRSDCKIYVSYIAVNQTRDLVDEVKSELSNYSDDFIFMNANNRAGSISEIDRDLFVGNDEYSFSFPCSQLFSNAYVTAEGYMVICCQDFENLTVVADLNKQTVSEAWNNECFVSYRRKYLRGDLDGTICYNCLNNSNEAVNPICKDFEPYKEDQNRKGALDVRIRKIISKKQEMKNG